MCVGIYKDASSNKGETGEETSPPTPRKRASVDWTSNPTYHVVATETAEVELTLARHDDCWAKQKEQVGISHPKP